MFRVGMLAGLFLSGGFIKFAVMKKMCRICSFNLLAAVVAVVLGLTSVLQHHHHGCEGRLYFTIDGLTDYVIGDCNGDLVQHCESYHHHHDNDCSHSSHGSDCGMHFTDCCIDHLHLQLDMAQTDEPTWWSVVPVPVEDVWGLAVYDDVYIVKCPDVDRHGRRGPPVFA